MMDIVALVHQQNGTFGVTFPDLPGCVSVADSYEALLEMGAEALALHLEGMVEDGDAIPVFRNLTALERDAGLVDEFSYAEFATNFAVDVGRESVMVHPTGTRLQIHHRTSAAE